MLIVKIIYLVLFLDNYILLILLIKFSCVVGLVKVYRGVLVRL